MDQSEKSITLITEKSRNRFMAYKQYRRKISRSDSTERNFIVYFDHNNYVDKLFLNISTQDKEKLKLICIS